MNRRKPSPRPTGRRRWLRLRLPRRPRLILVTGLTVVATLLLSAAAFGYLLTNRLQGHVARVQGAFDGVDPSERPQRPPTAQGSLTFLLVGSDSLADTPTTGREAADRKFTPGKQRTDTIMLLHLAADRKSATVVSIPRDSWVTIPGRGKAKINAAYSVGGPSLMIRTVEKLTGDRIDHFGVIDFFGFRSIVDAIGGVDVQVARSTTDLGGHTFHEGMNHLDGVHALAYVRQRHGLPQGDLDRVHRQQNLIRAIMAKVGTIDPVHDPVQTYKLLDAGTRAITVDDRLTDDEMRALAFSVLGLHRGDVTFMTAPVRGLGREGQEGEQSVVYLNDRSAGDLWAAIRDDTMPRYIASHRVDALPETPR